MFFKKKNPIEVKQTCNTNGGLPECNLVETIRKLQTQLNNIEDINLCSILSKYFETENTSPFFNFFEFYNKFERLVIDSDKSNFNTYEEMFNALGKELDIYVDKDKQIAELNTKIKETKEKLGIQ